MPKPKAKQNETIVIPANIVVYTDKKTNVKTVAFPFSFTDGVPGIMSITHLAKLNWTPSTDIESITINFKQYED